jgi:TonB family protein
MHGSVTASVTLARGGEVLDVETKRGVNPLLDAAAARAFRTWRFAALGKDESANVTLTINFEIANAFAVHIYPPCELTIEVPPPDVHPAQSSSGTVLPRKK